MDSGFLFDKMLTDLDDAGVDEGERSGERALVYSGVAFGVLRGDDMRFRLGSDDLDARGALSLAGASQAHGESDWVSVPVAECNEWERLARQALERARSEAEAGA